MFEYIEVTAQYSNAVLVALLPFFSDFSKKLDLPIPIPITVHHIESFACGNQMGDVGGHLVLTNGAQFWFDHGIVSGFRTPRSYYNLQNPADIPKFFGPLNLTKNEALQLARDALKKLGYTPQQTFTDQEPETTLPRQIGTNTVPHYLFRWLDPIDEMTSVRVEVGGAHNLIQELWLPSPFLWREPLKVSVQPKPLGTKSPISLQASNTFLEQILPKVSEFAKKVRLPVKRPVRRAQIERVEFVDPGWDIRLKLTNGYWLLCGKDVVRGFSSPDSIYGRQPPDRPAPIREYLGSWNVTKAKAINLARETIRTAGYTVADFNADQEPEVTTPQQVGKYVVPRYLIKWVTRVKTNQSIAVAEATLEVDADKGTIKHMFLIGGFQP